jgi:hypothetical protein
MENSKYKKKSGLDPASDRQFKKITPCLREKQMDETTSWTYG